MRNRNIAVSVSSPCLANGYRPRSVRIELERKANVKALRYEWFSKPVSRD